MEWIVGITTGLFVLLLGVLGNAWKKRYWNPSEWRFDRVSGDSWRLYRTSHRPAFVVTLSVALAGVQPKLEYGMTKPVNRDSAPGSHREISDLIGGTGRMYSLWWVERDAWRYMDFEVHDAMQQFEMRQRQIKVWNWGQPGRKRRF